MLLLHGWPTSSFLWRNVMAPIARGNRVVAPDLPGFGGSDKPLDVQYDFDLFESTLDEFLAALDIDEVGLAVHDLGGPVGVHWAVHRPQRVTKLALLNTLLYPDFSEAVMAFIKACSEPELREQLTSPAGLEAAMGLGLADEANLTDEVDRGRARAVRATTTPAARWPPPGSACRSRASPRSSGCCRRCRCRCGSSTASATGSCPTSPRRWRA